MAGLDVEWIGFFRRLKPALRLTVDPARVPEVSRRFIMGGAQVCVADVVARLAGREVAVLYVAYGVTEAAELRDIERPILPGAHSGASREVQLAAHRELGLRLGFPRCCVEAFCERAARGVDVLPGSSARGLAEDYVALRDAWVATADARLNPLAMAVRDRLVSHYPCRYDCETSGTQIARLADGLSPADAARLAAMQTRLSGAWVVTPGGTRARAVLDPIGVVQSAEPLRDGAGRMVEADGPKLAARLVGARVHHDGRVEGPVEDPRAPPWCVRFADPLVAAGV